MNNPLPKPSLNYSPPPKASKKALYIFLGVCIVLVVLSVIFRLLVPPQVVQQDNTWLGITPGVSKETDLYRLLGKPSNRLDQSYGQELHYPSIYPSLPNKVLTNKDGEVIMIQNMVNVEPEQFLGSYVEKFGEPDLKMYSYLAETAPAHVFLSKGIVVIAHAGNDQIEQIWYFEPTTAADFKTKWQEFLADEVEPEQFPPADLLEPTGP